MEEEKQLAGEDRLSGEIVEVYRQPLPRGGGGAVQPPPAGTACRARAAPPAAQDRAVDFPGLPGGGAGRGPAGSWIWYLLPAGSSADPFEYRYDHGWEEEEDASGAVTIPTIRSGRAPCWRWRRTTAGS